jgi:hypothetical protein
VSVKHGLSAGVNKTKEKEGTMPIEISRARSFFTSSFLGKLCTGLLMAALLNCLGGCATSDSQVATTRIGMTEEDREVMKKAQLGVILTTLAGVGSSYAAAAYGHNGLAAGLGIGALAIDFILFGIVLYEKTKEDIRPCTNFIPSSGGPTYLPRCRY